MFAQQLLHGLDPYMDKLEMQELVVLMAALAKVRFKPQEAWLSRFFALSMEVLPQYGPGYITILLRWAGAPRCAARLSIWPAGAGVPSSKQQGSSIGHGDLHKVARSAWGSCIPSSSTRMHARASPHACAIDPDP